VTASEGALEWREGRGVLTLVYGEVQITASGLELDCAGVSDSLKCENDLISACGGNPPLRGDAVCRSGGRVRPIDARNARVGSSHPARRSRFAREAFDGAHHVVVSSC
jgi:hypothetical protein